MAIVKGNSVIFEIDDGRGNYKPFACARSVTINMLSELTGKSTIGSGDWKEKELLVNDWNFSCDGVIYLSKNGFADTGNFIQLWKTKTPALIKFLIVDTAANNIQMAGVVLINSVAPSGAVNQAGAVQIMGEGTGELWSNTSFQIINEQPDTPAAGQTTLTFGFDSYPGATGYTIRTTNITTGVITETLGGPSPRTMAVTTGNDYSFALRYEPGGFYGYEIFWPYEPAPPLIINAFWGWQAVPFTPATLPGFVYQRSNSFLSNDIFLTDFTNAPDGSHIAVKYPNTIAKRTKWKNTDFNYGQIPDQVFNSIYTDGVYWYIYSRVTVYLDSTFKKINFIL